MRISQLFKEHRTERGLSQRALAEGLCTHTHISRIEAGKNLPSPELLLQLAERLHIAREEAVLADLESGPDVSQLADLAIRLAGLQEHELSGRVLAVMQAQLDASRSTYKRSLALYYRAKAHWHEVLGEFREGYRVARQGLELVQEWRADPLMRAQAYYQVGTLALKLAMYPEAERTLFQSWWAIQAADPARKAAAVDALTRLHQRIVRNLGIVLLLTRKTERAWMVYEQARAVWQALNLEVHESPDLLSERALAAVGVGELAIAQGLLEQVLERRELSCRLRVRVLTNLGLLWRLQGDHQTAASVLTQAWELTQQHGVGNRAAICLELGHLALLRRDAEVAAHWLQHSGISVEHANLESTDSPLVIERGILEARLAYLMGEDERAVTIVARIEANPAVPVPHRLRAALERIRIEASLDVAHASLALLASDLDRRML